MTDVVALGDSFSCGEGVGVRTPHHLTWTTQLAGRLPRGTLRSYAAPGARAADVRVHQLPHVGQPDVVTLLVGLNDVARTGFDVGRVRADLRVVVLAAAASGATVLLGRLHDPSRVLSLPPPLRRLVVSRVAQINAATDELAAEPAVRILDLDAVDELRTRSGWAVDHVHPSHSGHAAIAAAAAEVLRTAGWDVLPARAAVEAAVPSRLDRLRWFGRHGAPYALTHAADFAGPLLSACRWPART